MNHDRLFVLQIVLAIEEQWLAASKAGPPVRTERAYKIDDLLFSAADEEAAYRTARKWVDRGAFSDSNHDGPGDLTCLSAIGIHQLEEVARSSELAEKAQELYGISLPGFDLTNVDSNGIPLVRQKEELEVFRLLRLLGGGRLDK